MALIVQKYGGSSVADTESIKRVAKRVVETEKKGNKVAVVVSAMGDTTDDLIDQALSIDSNPPEREMDMLMTAGERISMSLLAMAHSRRRQPCPLLHRSAGRLLHRRPLRRGPHQGRETGPREERALIGRHRHRCRLPGHQRQG